MEQQQQKPNITPAQMLVKLDMMYQRQEEIVKEGRILLQDKNVTISDMVKLKNEYNQLVEDIELMQTMLMHQSNKGGRTVND